MHYGHWWLAGEKWPCWTGTGYGHTGYGGGWINYEGRPWVTKMLKLFKPMRKGSAFRSLTLAVLSVWQKWHLLFIKGALRLILGAHISITATLVKPSLTMTSGKWDHRSCPIVISSAHSIEVLEHSVWAWKFLLALNICLKLTHWQHRPSGGHA